MSAAWRESLGGLRARRGRAVLGAVGVAMAAAMLATAATVGYGLASGFSRSAAAADLPDVIARFAPQPASSLARRIRALPDIAAFTLSQEFSSVSLQARGHETEDGVLEAISGDRHGYAVVAGHDISSAGAGAVVAQGLASAWGLRVGETIQVGGLAPQRIVGLAQEPDDVAYPLAAARIYVAAAALATRAQVSPLAPLEAFAPRPAPAGANGGEANVARIWLRDPAQLDAVLVQARVTSYGLHNLRLLTRSGVRVLLDEAAGIVIALLAALSLIALLTAGVMLAAAARAELQRRLRGLGVRRAIGSTRAHVARVAALEALLMAAPAAALGVTAGALAASGPDDRLLALLNERAPGAALALPLTICFALAVALPVLSSSWPAWRAAGRAPVQLLRGAELRASGRSASRPRRGGLTRLGARLVAARRVRLVATLALLGFSAGFVLLLLALAGELKELENDPKALGRRYELTAALPASAAAAVAHTPGVAAAAPRYELTALDSFSLGETIDVIAYRGDHTSFEAPPLLSGTRLRGNSEAEVGEGLAQVLGLSAGSTLALTLPSGSELRLRVAGVVSSLDHDGRVAYVPAAALLAAEPAAPEQIAVRVRPNASTATVAARLGAEGASVSHTNTITGQGNALVAALTAVLRAVAVIDGLVCLYALIQALALTAHERRATIAVLRACGAGVQSVRALLAGAALAVVVPAALVAVLLERLVLGPALAHIAVSYVSLALTAGAGDIALLLAGLTALALVAVWWVARRACREPIAPGLA